MFLFHIVANRPEYIFQAGGALCILVFLQKLIVSEIGFGVFWFEVATGCLQGFTQLIRLRRQRRKHHKRTVCADQCGCAGFALERGDRFDSFPGECFPVTEQSGEGFHKGHLFHVGLPFLVGWH